MDATLYVLDGSEWDGKVPYVNGKGSYRKLCLDAVVGDWGTSYTFAAVS